MNHYDVIVVGAGVCGIALTKAAAEKKLRVLCLEKEKELGGIWRDLPKWQDIQVRPQDWTINNIPIHGVKQEAILKNLKDWVHKYGLGGYFKFSHRVTKATPADEGWEVQTDQGSFRSRYLVAAPGAFGLPFTPEYANTNSNVETFHSATLFDPKILAGKRVTVVGGGASAFDLLDLAIEQEASEIHWVYRSLRWVIPTTQPKHQKTNLRPLATMQMAGVSEEKLTEHYNKLLPAKYDYFGIKEIQPDYAFEWNRDQLVPGRPRMIQELSRIKRHPGNVKDVTGNLVSTESEQFETDLLLFGTGYKLNLDFLGLDRLQRYKNPIELRKGLGGLVRSLDYENLFIMGIVNQETVGIFPWSQSVIAKSIVAHILGKIEFTKKPSLRGVNHYDVLRLMASFDHYNYPFWWKIKHRLLTLYYSKFEKKPLWV